MSTDKIREIGEKIAHLKAQLEKLEDELEKAKEAGKRGTYAKQDGAGRL